MTWLLITEAAAALALGALFVGLGIADGLILTRLIAYVERLVLELRHKGA